MEGKFGGGMECCMDARILLHLGDKQAMLPAALLPTCAMRQGVLWRVRVLPKSPDYMEPY